VSRAHTLVVVNPEAGGGRTRRLQPLIADFLALRAWPADFATSCSSEDFRRIAADGARDDYRYLVALGGDGSFHHLVESAFGCDVALGFFPCGNGNDIAANLGLPQDTLAAANAFVRGKPRPIDLVRVAFPEMAIASRELPQRPRVRPTIFVGVGGVGLDAEAAHLAGTKFRRLPGVTRYLAGALWAWRSFRGLELEAEIDGVLWRDRILFAAVANGPCYGSGVRIAPDARVDDGWLDVTFVREMAFSRLVEALPVVLRTGDIRWPEVSRVRCRRVALRTSRPALVHGDGEVLGESPVEFEIVPRAVRVMTPPIR